VKLRKVSLARLPTLEHSPQVAVVEVDMLPLRQVQTVLMERLPEVAVVPPTTTLPTTLVLEELRSRLSLAEKRGKASTADRVQFMY
jgi:hypothetical protein